LAREGESESPGIVTFLDREDTLKLFEQRLFAVIGEEARGHGLITKFSHVKDCVSRGRKTSNIEHSTLNTQL
jgi:hypothetical protein